MLKRTSGFPAKSTGLSLLAVLTMSLFPALGSPQAAAPAPPPQKEYEDVLKLWNAKFSEKFIRNKVAADGTVYHLTADDLVTLKAAGIPEGLIEFMLETGRQAKARTAPASPSPAAEVKTAPVPVAIPVAAPTAAPAPAPELKAAPLPVAIPVAAPTAAPAPAPELKAAPVPVAIPVAAPAAAPAPAPELKTAPVPVAIPVAAPAAAPAPAPELKTAPLPVAIPVAAPAAAPAPLLATPVHEPPAAPGAEGAIIPAVAALASPPPPPGPKATISETSPAARVPQPPPPPAEPRAPSNQSWTDMVHKNSGVVVFKPRWDRGTLSIRDNKIIWSDENEEQKNFIVPLSHVREQFLSCLKEGSGQGECFEWGIRTAEETYRFRDVSWAFSATKKPLEIFDFLKALQPNLVSTKFPADKK